MCNWNRFLRCMRTISIFCEKILGLQRKPISHANKITIFTFSAAPKQQAHFHKLIVNLIIRKQKPRKEKNGLKVGLVVIASYSFVGLMMDYRLISCGNVSDASIVPCFTWFGAKLHAEPDFSMIFVWKGMFPARNLYFSTFIVSVATADIFALVVHLHWNFREWARLGTVTISVNDDSEGSKLARGCKGWTATSTNVAHKNWRFKNVRLNYRKDKLLRIHLQVLQAK